MWGISNFLKRRKNDKCTQISSKGKGMETGMLGIGWTIDSSYEKVWGVGKADSSFKLLHVYRIYDTKGYGKVLWPKVCRLHALSPSLSLYAFRQQEWSFLCLTCFAWQTNQKKRLLVVCWVWNWVCFLFCLLRKAVQVWNRVCWEITNFGLNSANVSGSMKPIAI